MDVISFKQSDYEWYRVIAIINGAKVSKYADKADQMRNYYAWVEDYCMHNGGKECNKELMEDYNTFVEEYNRLFGEKDYNRDRERMENYNTFVKEYYRYYKEIESVDRYGDGIYPGWLYYELKGGDYWNCPELKCGNCPEKLSAAANPYIPYVSRRELSTSVQKCDECCNCRDEEAEPESAGVLGCACGSDGCSVYLVRITETENSVIWDDYFAFKFNTPNYFHFEFEKKQYYEEVEKLVDFTLQIGEKEGLPIEIINNIRNNGKEIEKESNNYIQYPKTLSEIIDQMDKFSQEKILGNLFHLACMGKRKDWVDTEHYTDEDMMRNTGDKNIDLLWEVIDKIEEVIKKIKD